MNAFVLISCLRYCCLQDWLFSGIAVSRIAVLSQLLSVIIDLEIDVSGVAVWHSPLLPSQVLLSLEMLSPESMPPE
jgi:hypothetical protein